MKTAIFTNRYEFEHGHTPRGRGSWAFHPNFNVDGTSPEIFWFNGLYTEAKKAAVKHFTEKGVPQIQALS